MSCFGRPKHLSQFSDHCAVLKGAVGSYQGNVWEPLENVCRYIVTIGPGEVDVKVRWIGAVKIDESFEIKVQFNGVYIGDAKEVCNQAIGSASPSDVEIALAACIACDVPVD